MQFEKSATLLLNTHLNVHYSAVFVHTSTNLHQPLQSTTQSPPEHHWSRLRTEAGQRHLGLQQDNVTPDHPYTATLRDPKPMAKALHRYPCDCGL